MGSDVSLAVCQAFLFDVVRNLSGNSLKNLSKTELLSLVYAYKDEEELSSLVECVSEWTDDKGEFGACLRVMTNEGVARLTIKGRVRFKTLNGGDRIVDQVIEGW